jgi:hypothetical protein
MVINDRKRDEAAAIALKQASVIKTLALASVAFKNGTVRVIPNPKNAKFNKDTLQKAA